MVSASVLALQKERWSGRVRIYTAAFRSGGSKQYKNWLAEANSTASLAFQAIPWDEHGRLSITNNAYRTAFARRYRLPLRLACDGCHGSSAGNWTRTSGWCWEREPLASQLCYSHACFRYLITYQFK